ncbi:lipopolysaccharide biosynthesis protein [Pseudoxanthomonas sp. SGD-10]|nr:lipopolysaccharide biosynthesis protein [Pseudoxanthomonas sp. SGD-10]
MAGQSNHSTSTEATQKARIGENYPVYAEDEITLKELVLKIKEWIVFLWTKKWTIIIAGVIGGVLGLTYAFLKKPVYTATTTFVLESGEKGGGLGAYAGLASMVGIDLGGSGGGVFQGDNILELYKSRKMIQQALLTKDTFDSRQQLLIERFIEFNELRDKWKKKPELKNINFDLPYHQYTLQHDSIIGELVKEFNKEYLRVTKPDKKLSIIKVEFSNKDELFAKSFTDNIVATVNNFYVETKTKKSAENLAVLQYQADSVKRVLNQSIGGVAAATDANPNTNPAFQSLRVPSQRKQVDVQASAAVYQEIIKNLELAKITFRREKPLIQVIDEPVLPLKEDRVSKVKGILAGMILSLFLTIFYLSITKFILRLFI